VMKAGMDGLPGLTGMPGPGWAPASPRPAPAPDPGPGPGPAGRNERRRRVTTVHHRGCTEAGWRGCVALTSMFLIWLRYA
jgi:hypothetical protein